MSRKIYIMLSQTGTYFSRAIKLYTGYNYNHTSIALDRDLKELYSFGRRGKLGLPLPSGFVKEDKDNGIFSTYSKTTCRVYELEVSEEEYQKVKDVIEEFKIEDKKYKYSILGIFTIMFNIPFNRRYRFVCSQFVAHVLNEGKVVEFEKDISLIKPEDFETIDNSEVIYSGLLSKYGNPHM